MTTIRFEIPTRFLSSTPVQHVRRKRLALPFYCRSFPTLPLAVKLDTNVHERTAEVVKSAKAGKAGLGENLLSRPLFDDTTCQIRFIVRAVMNGPTVLPDVEHGMTTATESGFNREISAGSGGCHHSLSSTNASPRLSHSIRVGAENNGTLPGGGGGNGSLPSEAVPTGSGTGMTSKKSGHGAPETGAAIVASALSAAAPGGVKPNPYFIVGESTVLVVAEKGDGGDRRKKCSTTSVSILGQQQPQEDVCREGGDTRATVRGSVQNIDLVAGEGVEAPCPTSGAFRGKELRLSGTESLDPRLKLASFWEEGGASAGSPVTAASNNSSGGVASARTVGASGSAAAGQTFPGPRPLSAPLIRPVIGASRLNATSPTRSVRRLDEASVRRDRELSMSLSRTAGVSLAGRLMSYATRPGGKLDVFAASRDGQV